METGQTIPGQEIGSGFQKPNNSDGFVTIDVESFALHKDFSSSTPRITLQKNLSRKGLIRSNNERKLQCDANSYANDTSFPHSPLRGSITPEKPVMVGPTDHSSPVTTATAPTVSGSPLHQITVTTATVTNGGSGNIISDQNREIRRLGFVKKSSFKRSHGSWMLDPKKIVLFFATLSSMGSILLIIFTLSISKSNTGDMPLD